MAKLKNGLFGLPSGKIGEMVVAHWKGIQYVRSLPKPGNKLPTPAQLRQRARFTAVNTFLKPLKSVVQKGFLKVSSQMTGYNAALSYNYKAALQGDYPAYFISWPHAVLTMGALPIVENISTKALPGNQIRFTWRNNGGTGMARTNDRMILVVYCTELQQAITSMDVYQRQDEQAVIHATAFAGKKIKLWVSCMSQDEEQVATSMYAGELLVD
jgi:hypothetical protein